MAKLGSAEKGVWRRNWQKLGSASKTLEKGKLKMNDWVIE